MIINLTVYGNIKQTTKILQKFIAKWMQSHSDPKIVGGSFDKGVTIKGESYCLKWIYRRFVQLLKSPNTIWLDGVSISICKMRPQDKFKAKLI